ncbi:hypothetical protein Tco_1148687 [Tanacetum coccineum]
MFSLKADSDRGVIGLAISLPLYLVDALDLVEDDCFMVVHMICEILVLDNKDLDIVEQQQQLIANELLPSLIDNVLYFQDIFKIVSIAVHFGTSGESSIAGTVGIMTVEGL